MARQNRIGTHKTSVVHRNDWNVVTYHETDVVSFNDTMVQLDSGGWLTSTTKTRMNQTANQFGLGFRVYQDKGVWWVRVEDQTIKFSDGMIFNYRAGQTIDQVTV